MAQEEVAKKNTVDELLNEIFNGVNATAARDWMDKYLWVKVIQKVIQISNCPAKDVNDLIQLKSDLKALLNIAQDLKIEVANVRMASERLRKLYEVKL